VKGSIVKMRLGVIYEPGVSGAYYRAIFPLQALQRRGHTVVWPRGVDDIPMREFLRCDLVHCYRRMDRIDDLRRLSAQGVAVSFDNDDNLAASEFSGVGRGLKAHRYNKAAFRQILQAAKLADVTTTTTDALAELYRREGVDNVTVLENHLQRDAPGFGARSTHDGTVVGWVAGGEHRVDLERIAIADALERLLEVHPQLRVLTVGLRLPLRSERYEHILEVPFGDLLRATSAIDIGIAPLADTAFNRSRSSVKLKEYGAGGAAWLASPVEPYRHLGGREGGQLVGDEDWFAAIDELVRNPRRRRRLAGRALRWAKTQTIERHVSGWEQAFGEAVERARRRRDERSA
jgi:hypothetical protein